MSTGKPMSGSLARRLAEAADGYRNQGDVYFLARWDPDASDPYNFEISRGYDAKHTDKTKLDTADHKKIDDPMRYAWFGPFRTEDKKVPDIEVVEIIVRVRKKTGADIKEITIPTRPLTAVNQESPFDMIFWSTAALEKFAIPYYARLYSGTFADAVVTKFTNDGLFLAGHRVGTEWDDLKDPFTLTAIELDQEGNFLKFRQVYPK